MHGNCKASRSVSVEDRTNSKDPRPEAASEHGRAEKDVKEGGAASLRSNAAMLALLAAVAVPVPVVAVAAMLVISLVPVASSLAQQRVSDSAVASKTAA